jgi:alkaline phosphatase
VNRSDVFLLAATSTAALSVAAHAQQAATTAPAAGQRPNNVIFFHPDGAGINHWTFLRYMQHGPDGETEWDKLPGMAVYSCHLSDSLTDTSNAGAATHATGVKVHAASFGLDRNNQPVRAASGETATIAEEAIRAGRAAALIETGPIAEPGTAAFVAKTPRRGDVDEIARQLIESGARVIMAADSEAGGLRIQGSSPGDEIIRPGQPLPERDRNGAPMDGVDGTSSPPWQAAADRAGNRLHFAITWGAEDDTSGNIPVRAAGVNSEHVRGLMDNTAIYRVMYRTLFGRVIG